MRQDLPQYQHIVFALTHDFSQIANDVDSLDLYSANEQISEISVRSLPFLNIDYYLAKATSLLLTDEKGQFTDTFLHKLVNLQASYGTYLKFLSQLREHRMLSKEQIQKLENLSSGSSPSSEPTLSPMAAREEKIKNYKLQKQLEARLSVLEEYYEKHDVENEQIDVFDQFDEEVVSKIFQDQLTLHALLAFSDLGHLQMEIRVLKNMPLRPQQPIQLLPQNPSLSDDYGYTSKLETVPVAAHNAKAGDLVSRQGKILRPFTITNNRSQIERKVRGTGQVLPSMLVEEYLDYELANGKMAAPPPPTKDSDLEAPDLEEEMEARQWDDWKDDNPKGSGNTKANIG